MHIKPINLYRSDADREVWEWAEREAESRRCGISAVVASALREQKDRVEAATGVLPLAGDGQ